MEGKLSVSAIITFAKLSDDFFEMEGESYEKKSLSQKDNAPFAVLNYSYIKELCYIFMAVECNFWKDKKR